MLQAYGFLPATPLIDAKLMRTTYDFVLKEWDWKSTWGWDYPVLAMTAARLGSGEDAVNALLLDTPSIASKRWVYEQYDSTVQANTLLAPGGDAGELWGQTS